MDQSSRWTSWPSGWRVARSADLKTSHYSVASENAAGSSELVAEPRRRRQWMRACRLAPSVLRLHILWTTSLRRKRFRQSTHLDPNPSEAPVLASKKVRYKDEFFSFISGPVSPEYSQCTGAKRMRMIEFQSCRQQKGGARG